jgi:hypothetical protein
MTSFRVSPSDGEDLLCPVDYRLQGVAFCLVAAPEEPSFLGLQLYYTVTATEYGRKKLGIALAISWLCSFFWSFFLQTDRAQLCSGWINDGQCYATLAAEFHRYDSCRSPEVFHLSGVMLPSSQLFAVLGGYPRMPFFPISALFHKNNARNINYGCAYFSEMP